VFNFSANHVTVVSSLDYPKCVVYVVKDLDTNRCYKVYDYSKSSYMTPGCVYCISGKVNTADKLYLILENHKTDKDFQQSSDSVVKVQNPNSI
jgi:hypothetical protein